MSDTRRQRAIWKAWAGSGSTASGYTGVVIDGLRGLAEALRAYPVQHCQFHQMMTVRHYLTGNPDIEASRELLSLVSSMTRMDKESFIGADTVPKSVSEIEE